MIYRVGYDDMGGGGSHHSSMVYRVDYRDDLGGGVTSYLHDIYIVGLIWGIHIITHSINVQ